MFQNPFETMSSRTIRRIYSLAVVLALLASATNVLETMVYKATSNDQCAWRPVEGRNDALLITDVVVGGVADKAGIRNGDILLKIDSLDFQSSAQAMALINKHKVGEYATYEIERDGTRIVTQVEILKVVNISYLSLVLLGLGFLVVGYVVVMTKPQGVVQRMFARYSIYLLLVCTLLPPQIAPGDSVWKIILLSTAAIVSRVFGPPTFVKFFLHFPVRRPSLEKKWLSPALYVVALLLLLPLLGPLSGKLPGGVVTIFALSPFLFYFAGLGFFASSYFRSAGAERKNQLRPILIAVFIGLLAFIYPFVVSLSNPFAIFLNPTLLLPGLLIVIVPLAFGYSIFRYRLMDIDLIVKRSLIYGVVTASIAAIYLVLVYGVGSVLGEILGQSENQLLNVVAFITIALLFDPIKRRTQAWIDRSFYQDRYNYQKALLEFSQELPRQMDLNAILNSIVNRISSTMHVEKVAVILCDEQEGCHAVTRNIGEECCQFETGGEGLMALLEHTRSAQSIAFFEEEAFKKIAKEQDRRMIQESGVVLAVPMMLKDRLIGSVNVGPKMSGRAYSQEDIDLLTTVASQAAIAIENARLHKSEIERQKIEEELALARRIQQGLLPKANPLLEGIDVSGVSIPALTVGGDYFDFIELGPKKLLVVVADVSGKGMSAALYMSKVQGMIQAVSRLYERPKEILTHVNRHIYDGIERKSFITMIIALFDLERNEVRICRAGHNKALIGSNGKLHFLEGVGMGLGLERGPVFENYLEEVSLPLKRDSLFVFYSDGLPEAMNERKQQLGEEAIFDMVSAKRHLSASELQRSILTTVEEFQGSAEQHDDLTLVIVKSHRP